MRIESIHIEAYRSLYDVELSPGPLTVLVGPNNSGKSNLVEALDFLGDVHRHGVEVAVTRKGGFENIAHRRMRRTKRPIAFDVSATLSRQEIFARRRPRRATIATRESPPEPDVRIRHRFEISSTTGRLGADFVISSEVLDIWDLHRPLKDARPTLTVTRSKDDEVSFRLPRRRRMDGPGLSDWYPLDQKDYQRFIQTGLTPTSSILTALSIQDYISAFAAGLTGTRLYQLAPIECRRPGVSTPNADLELHGGNLPALVAFMKQNHSREWREILQAMRRIVPGLSDVETDFTHDRRLTLKFAEEGVGRPWTSEDVSDGTIQSLALFAALFDPRSALALIEEPENSVHPWIVRNFVDVCREVHDKQIFITTHSPALLEYLSPEEVSLVWRQDGRTHVEPLTSVDPDAVAAWEQGRSTVYELLDSGLLPMAIPGGYQ